MTQPVYVDVETTGLDPLRHEVFEIAVIVDGERRLWWLSPDLSTADPNALRMNRYYEREYEFIERDRSEQPSAIAREIARLTTGRQLCGFNPAFDAGFLDALLRRHGMVPAWDYHLAALESMCAGFLLEKANHEPDAGKAAALRHSATNWNSTEMSSLVGVDRSEFDKHTAMGDALWHEAVYVALTSVPSGPKPTRPARQTKAKTQEPVAPAHGEGPAEPEPGSAPEKTRPTASDDGPVPPNMPFPKGGEYECVNQDCQAVIGREQAVRSWSRFREFLCHTDFVSPDAGSFTR